MWFQPKPYFQKIVNLVLTINWNSKTYRNAHKILAHPACYNRNQHCFKCTVYNRNCYDGNASYLFENGDLFNGQWKKEMNGYRRYEYVNGDVYKGAWKKDSWKDGARTLTPMEISTLGLERCRTTAEAIFIGAYRET